MSRFMRSYVLVFTVEGKEITITPEINIVFDVVKSRDGTALSKMTLNIFNLSPEKRELLSRDPISITEEDRDKIITVELKVGYNKTLETIYKGTVYYGRNERQGVDIVTTIESLDGGFANARGYISKVVQPGANPNLELSNELKNYGLNVGKVEKSEGLTRPKVLVGNIIDLINKSLKPNEYFLIDNQTIYISDRNTPLTLVVPLVNASTGLVSTPTRESQRITFKSLMNPEIRVGGRVKLESTTAPSMNGVYLVSAIQYNGDYSGDDWSQTVVCELFGQ